MYKLLVISSPSSLFSIVSQFHRHCRKTKYKTESSKNNPDQLLNMSGNIVQFFGDVR